MALYRDGQREDVSGDPGDALAQARASRDGFVWLGLHEPTEHELERVSKEFGLHPLAAEDAIHAHQRPKLEHYGDTLFAVLKTITYIDATSDIETGEIMLFLGSGFVVTARHGQGNPLGTVRRRLEGDEEILRRGPLAVLYAVCDAVVDTYTEVMTEIQLDLDEVEQRTFSPSRGNDAAVIYRLKREVLEFRRAALPLATPLRWLAEGQVSGIDTEIRPFFRDVADHVLRVTTELESANDLLASVLNAHLAQVSVQQNEDMRRISAWVAILAVPTMVAGIYGMNFTHMPALEWSFGYPLVLGVMLAICALLYWAFRRSGWL